MGDGYKWKKKGRVKQHLEGRAAYLEGREREFEAEIEVLRATITSLTKENSMLYYEIDNAVQLFDGGFQDEAAENLRALNGGDDGDG